MLDPTKEQEHWLLFFSSLEQALGQEGTWELRPACPRLSSPLFCVTTVEKFQMII